MRDIMRILAVLLIACTPAAAQELHDTSAVQTDSLAPLTIETDMPGAVVFLDGDSVGVTPCTVPSSYVGRRHLRLVPREASNWLVDPILDTMDIVAGVAQTKRYAFSPKLLIISTPSEAAVFFGDSLIGTTPLVVRGISGPLRLQKMGYADTTLDISQAARGILTTGLKKIWTSTPEESIFKDSEGNGSSLRLYITGATTVLAGAASAYFKVKADNIYSKYVRTGDPNDLAEVNRLDTAAGIALAATQLSLGLFTYFILTE